MWVGIEATTLLTAFLICLHATPASLEAMWKYLHHVLGRRGVRVHGHAAGRRFDRAATARGRRAALDEALRRRRPAQPGAAQGGFLFLLVGYGTKAGLAPMHSWLPDAHSQAPAPVSALFSGFLLNSALYCILRYVPLVERATGAFRLEPAAAGGLRRDLDPRRGGVHLLSARREAAAGVSQRGAHRHHRAGHGAGRRGRAGRAVPHAQPFARARRSRSSAPAGWARFTARTTWTGSAARCRAAPVWGKGLLLSLLCLIGVAPFAIFMSELQIVSAAASRRRVVDAGAFPVRRRRGVRRRAQARRLDVLGRAGRRQSAKSARTRSRPSSLSRRWPRCSRWASGCPPSCATPSPRRPPLSEAGHDVPLLPLQQRPRGPAGGSARCRHGRVPRLGPGRGGIRRADRLALRTAARQRRAPVCGAHRARGRRAVGAVGRRGGEAIRR